MIPAAERIRTILRRLPPLCRVLALWASLLASLLAALPTAAEERQSLPTSVERIPDAIAATARNQTESTLEEAMDFEIPLRMRNFTTFQDRVSARNPVPPAELERDFLPLATDYEALKQWAVTEGFEITGTDPQRLALFLRGSIRRIQHSLQVEMVRVSRDGRDYHAARTAPSLPKSLATPVLGINGLQPYRRPVKHQGMQTQAVTTPYHINDILGAYNANGLGLTGSGQTIAILIDTVANNSDLSAFWSNNGVTRTGTVTNINVNNVTLPAASGEESLDEEWTSGIAPGANLRVYAAGNLTFVNLDKSIVQIINDLPSQPTMHVLSISLGLGEAYIGTSEMATETQ